MLLSASAARACPSSSSPDSILTSTARTAAVALSRLRRPWGVSRVGMTFPTASSTGRATRPSSSRACSRTFIDWRVTNAPRASSEPESPGRWASSSRHE